MCVFVCVCDGVSVVQAQQSKAATVTGGGGEGGNGDLTEACRRLSSIPDGTIMSLDQAVNFCIDCSC